MSKTESEIWQRLTINESRVLIALLKHSKPTKTKHHHECSIRGAYLSLNMKPASFAGYISALRKKGFYRYVIWETDPNRVGYKDHPRKCVMAWTGEVAKVRSDIAIVIDPVWFKDKKNGYDTKTSRGVLRSK